MEFRFLSYYFDGSNLFICPSSDSFKEIKEIKDNILDVVLVLNESGEFSNVVFGKNYE